MRVVLDANIIIAALLGSRGKTVILTSQNHAFYAPDKIVTEIKKYKNEINQKAGWEEHEFDIYFDALFFFITIIQPEKYATYLETAKKVSTFDTKDAEYIACALAVAADFIWTEDAGFSEQRLMPVKNTGQFIEENK